jgi:LAO/AO transport system kinase
VLINKADDGLESLAGRSAAEYRAALRLLHPRSAEWKVEVQTCSARDGVGVGEVWATVLRHRQVLERTGQFDHRRAAQARGWMWSEVKDSLVNALQENPEVRRRIPELEAAASEGRLAPTMAARQLLEIFLKSNKEPE